MSPHFISFAVMGAILVAVGVWALHGMGTSDDDRRPRRSRRDE